MKGLQSAVPTRTFALGLILLFVGVVKAREPLTGGGIAPPPPPPQAGMKAASCAPATEVAELAFNNVRAIIQNGGNKWTEPGVNRPGYEVPITEFNTGPKAIYAGALWMGGLSPDNQLKIAAVLYRASGRNDFWPGPLTNTGDASVDSDVCLAFDRFWNTSRAQAEAHIQWMVCQEEGNCPEVFPNGYSVPTAFQEWPAMGNVDAGQDLYLAPFHDYDGDGSYDPFSGDYPDYGFSITVEECKNKVREDPVPLFGDDNIFWIFNDKGNVHTETQGQPIGLEVRAQAFSFNTDDEINNMTFYNYTVINQGSQTLLNTYFGHFIDPDLGCSNDDFVGCDVQRGLGFAYNWQDVDVGCLGAVGYGGPNPPPPAIGVDFFEGPFQDADTIDNPGPFQNLSCGEYQAQKGIPYAGIGIGYGDGVVDNERFGMRAFIYFNREGNANMTDPANAAHFYNFLRSIWKNNQPQSYGGTGFTTESNFVRAFYMFPWNTDPVGWGTNCVPQADWREEVPTPTLPDRRFVQSAGPFTLEPGAYNNVTVGVVWARSAVGGAASSLLPLRRADDKAQALFDNCFKIFNGPDAPDVTIRELDRELILFLTNPQGSNNFNEAYTELDATIPETNEQGQPNNRFYGFQGYKIYQLKDATVSVSDLENVNLARLVYQGDVRDGVSQIINYPYSETMFNPSTQIPFPIPTEMVNGDDDGVLQAIRITEDKFAQGDPKLVNFKNYYYLAIAYAYNNYLNFDLGAGVGGQQFPYRQSRKAAFGGIRSVVGIPHKPAPMNGGTVQNAQFGDRLPITRLEGQGNGGLVLELTPSSESAIMTGPPWRQDELDYKAGSGPIDVKVVDPLKVPDAQFEVWFQDSITPGNLNDAYWYIVNLSNNDTVASSRTINVSSEQLLLDYGISVTIGQVFYTLTGANQFTPPLTRGTITFADPSKAWFTGVSDAEGEVPANWIRSGTETFPDTPVFDDRAGKDNGQDYETILNGTWAPWGLVGQADFQPGNAQQVNLTMNSVSPISGTPSIQLVMTADKSKWTRSPVLEQEANTTLSQGGAAKLALRASPSIDKNGRKAGTPGADNTEATRGGSQPTGMGWFPGYAIDLETGERLNIAYGENSFWGGEIGRDMIFNPSDQFTTEQGEPVFGGSHWIYVFRNDRRSAGIAGTPGSENRMPMYDEGVFIHGTIQTTQAEPLRRVFRAVGWVGSAMLVPGRQLLETDVRIVLSVAQPYLPYVNYPGSPDPIQPALNNGLPLYTFGTGQFATGTQVMAELENSLDLIGIVPNPYYAFSGYETSRLDNRVKFINLPQRCTISIYNVGGTLVRKFRKDNDLTYLDWDLKNTSNIPIAGGVYICHVDVPGVGERVIKWFGAMRPIDLQNF